VTVEDWVAYARKHGTDMVVRTARQGGLPPADVERLVAELRTLDPKFKPPRRGRRGRPARSKIPAADQAGRVCEHCGRPVTGRADRRTCSTACRVALKREHDRQAAPESADPPNIPIEEWTR
jgi:hypothetical protein